MSSSTHNNKPFHHQFPYLKRRAIVPASFHFAGHEDDKKKEHLAVDPDCKVDLNNVQGDVYYMFPKNFERFMFFIISDKDKFLKNLDTYRPYVTTAKQTVDNIKKIADRTSGEQLDILSTGVAFSKEGLQFLGHKDRLQDQHFDNGPMIKEKPILGDTGKWDDVFNNGKVHGVILVTAGTKATCDSKALAFRNIFKDSIKDKDITILDGRVRSGEGEHFGWRDSISQPALEYLSTPAPGQRFVPPGVIIMGYKGDPYFKSAVVRPKFSKDGSFMVFRKLEQAVLSLEDYVNANYVSIPPDEPTDGKPLSDDERKALFGARLVGRFKSGAPLAKTPYRDDTYFLDPDRINDFDYSTGNTPHRPPNCPFAAHVRKTAPRNLNPLIRKEYLDASVIVRAGIPYGDDVSPRFHFPVIKCTPECDMIGHPSRTGRSLGPNSIQTRSAGFFSFAITSIENGFMRQTGFASNDFFPITGLVPQKHGQDPILGGPPKMNFGESDVAHEGQVTLGLVGKNGAKYEVTGFSKLVDTSATAYTQDFFVTSRGGEYFFVPSISTLKDWAKGA